MSEIMQVIARCKAEEKQFQFESFTNDDAWKLGCMMMNIAQQNQYGVTIQICYQEQILFHVAHTGAEPVTADWIRRKHNTVMYAKTSTLQFAKQMLQDGKTLADLGLEIADYVEGGGGFPLIVKGQGVVGSIAVSGLVDVEDHKIMTDALAMFFGA